MVSVAHEGPGIDAKVVPKLFDRWRSDGGTGSTGIFSYLSRRLVEAHGGTLTVQNAADRGTTFWMAIPVGGSSEGDAMDTPVLWERRRTR